MLAEGSAQAAEEIGRLAEEGALGTEPGVGFGRRQVYLQTWGGGLHSGGAGSSGEGRTDSGTLCPEGPPSPPSLFRGAPRWAPEGPPM